MYLHKPWCFQEASEVVVAAVQLSGCGLTPVFR